MGMQRRIKPLPFNTKRPLFIFFILWSIVVTGLAIFNSCRLYQISREIGIREARSSFNKDQAIRYWSSLHGGVYVPIDSVTPANPYLSHISDRDIVTATGKKLTLMNPAYMIRQMNENFAAQYGVIGHITSLKPLRHENTADNWETIALLSFEQGNQESIELTKINGEPFLRLMQPMKVEQGCLKCHGHQGYSVGDIRGGVAISWPMDNILHETRQTLVTQSSALFLLWLLGSYFIFNEGQQLKKSNKQRNNALAEVEEIKEQLELVVASAHIGTWDWDVQSGAVIFNERWADMLGYTLAEINPHVSFWEELIHPDDLEETMATLTEHLENRTPNYMSEHRLRHKSGMWLWILDVGKVFKRDAEGRPLRAVGIHIDINDQKEQEDVRLQTSLQQEKFKHFESLQTMAGAIAHRFNNAMMVVQGNLDLIREDLPNDSEEFKIATSTAQAAHGASQIGTMMLSYVGQQSFKLQDLSLAHLVRESVTALEKLLHTGISIKFNSPAQPLYCSIDPQLIGEVVDSVLTNAIESLEEGGGGIDITFGCGHFKKKSFPIPFQNEQLKDGMYTYCQIKDTGHGISPENLFRIFEPFYTTRFVGRGLGLALTVGIMQSHRGGIIVESSPNQGTTVKLLFPALSSAHSISSQ